jgi:hypothetical protein
MAKSNRLASMSVEALLKLREDIGRALAQKATQLQAQLSRLGVEIGASSRHRSSLRGRKVRSNTVTKRATPGRGEERSPFGCARN